MPDNSADCVLRIACTVAELVSVLPHIAIHIRSQGYRPNGHLCSPKTFLESDEFDLFLADYLNRSRWTCNRGNTFWMSQNASKRTMRKELERYGSVQTVSEHQEHQ